LSTLLIISTQPPYFSSCAQDAIEAALAASNVGVRVTYVFSQKGLFQLIADQNSVGIGKKSLIKQIRVLSLYDIEDLYYIKEDAEELCLCASDISTEVEPLDLDAFNVLCDSFDAVLRF
jgi:tRNA 2-thiouridine synthesizing protein C